MKYPYWWVCKRRGCAAVASFDVLTIDRRCDPRPRVCEQCLADLVQAMPLTLAMPIDVRGDNFASFALYSPDVDLN